MEGLRGAETLEPRTAPVLFLVDAVCFQIVSTQAPHSARLTRLTRARVCRCAPAGSLGGRRPGPPAALFPTVLGQVYQRIDPDTVRKCREPPRFVHLGRDCKQG